MTLMPTQNDSSRSALSRRRVLRGAGAAVTLPFLETFAPRRARAADKPRRLILWFTPDGTMHWERFGGPTFFPAEGAERSWTLPPLSEPMTPIKDHIVLPYGLNLHASESADAISKNKLPHARRMRYMLTGGGGDSIDQVIAHRLNAGTRFRSLELGVATSVAAQWHDRMCYWQGSPVAPEADPNKAFERMFGMKGSSGMPDAERQRRLLRRTSVLDGVLDELKHVRARVAGDDVKRIDLHTSSIRDLEKSLASLTVAQTQTCQESSVDFSPIEGISQWHGADKRSLPNVDKIMTVQHQILVLALSCDLTRVATLQFSRSTSAQTYPFLPIKAKNEGQHGFAHNWEKSEEIPSGKEDYTIIQRWRAQQFTNLVQALKDTADGPGETLLDNSLAVWVTEMGNGWHRPDWLPWVMAGRAGGALRTGRFVKLGAPPHVEEPAANMMIAWSHIMGVPVERFGDDGTRPTPGIA